MEVDPYTLWSNFIATSHNRFSPQNVAFWKGNLLIAGKSRFVKYGDLARYYTLRVLGIRNGPFGGS